MRNRTVSAVVLGGFVLGGSVLAQTEPVRSEAESVQNYKVARASYEKARKSFEKRDLEKAGKELETCLKRMPEFSDAHFLLAKVDYLEKRYPESLAHMEQAVVTFDSEQRSLFRRCRAIVSGSYSGFATSRTSGSQDLRDSLSRATTDEQRAVIQNQIAQVEHNRDEIQRQLYEPPAEVVGMPADYRFFHGNILLRLNRLDDAAAQYREALRIKPDHADASNNLASLYLSAGHAQVAKEILDQAEANGVTVNAELKQAVLNALR